MNQITTLDQSSLLTVDLNDLADLPTFKVPPVGYYKLSVSCEVKKVGDNDAVTADYEIVEILEQADPAAAPAIVGDKFSEMFSLGNEFGVGKLKKFLATFAATFGTTNVGELIAQLQGVQVYATVKQRADKNKTNDDGTPKIYAVVEGLTVA